MPKNFFQNNIKKKIKNNFKIKFLFTIFSFISFSSSFFISKTSANAGVDNINSGIENIGSIVTTANKTIAGPVVLFLSALCTILFLWFLVIFLIHRNKGDDTQLGKDKKNLLWSMVALFFLVTVWGVIQVAQGILGITEKDKDIRFSKICLDDSCDGSRSSNRGGSGGGGNNPSGGTTNDNNSLTFNNVEQWILDAVNTNNEVNKIPTGKTLSTATNNRDPDVGILQRFLLSAGCYENNTIGEVDNQFGPKTENALKKWQQFNGVSADGYGIFYNATWDKMNKTNQRLCRDDRGEFSKALQNQNQRASSQQQADRQAAIDRNRANQAQNLQNLQNLINQANNLQKIVRHNDRGIQVLKWNFVLNYFCPDIIDKNSDTYSDETVIAVSALQEKYDINNPDGERTGGDTKRKLIEELEIGIPGKCFK